MPLPFRVVLTKKSDQSEEVCAGEISDADWATLETFRLEAAKLRTGAWVANGLDTNYTISGDGSGKIIVDWPNRPSDAVVREHLHLLRPFVLQKNNPTHFPKILNILRRYFTHPHLQNLLAEHRDGFRHGYGRAYFQLSVSATLEGASGQNSDDYFLINDERAFDLWVNAFEYHRDQDKRKQLTEKLGTEPDEMTVTTFQNILADKATAVLHVASFLDDLASSPTAVRARQRQT
jgi:hypothetical protein